MSRWWLRNIAQSLFVATAAWVAYNFLLLCLFGELLIWESLVWLRIAECIFAWGVLAFAIERWVHFIRTARRKVKK